MNRFSNDTTPPECDESALYESINGGISTCTRALAGIFVINGIEKTREAGKFTLDNESKISKRNNLFFFVDGLDGLINDHRLAQLIQSAQSSHNECQVIARETHRIEDMQTTWNKSKNITKEYLIKLRCDCKSSFGIQSPLVIHTERNNFANKLLEQPDRFNSYYRDLFECISYEYINKKTPDDLDISNLIKLVNNTIEQTKRVQSFQFSFDPESSRKELINNLRFIDMHISEFLPRAASYALFRIYRERINEEKSSYPSLFELSNMDAEVIDILDGNFPTRFHQEPTIQS